MESKACSMTNQRIFLKGSRSYDIDSQPIEKNLTPRQKKLQLKDIRKDITYYRKSYERADIQVDISGLNADEAARRVQQALENALASKEGRNG
jgi:shikimate kinase